MNWPAELTDFIAAENTLTLATINADGSPHAADLFYAVADGTFYFLSDPKTRHIQNLARESRVSATIHGHASGWQDIRGIQMDGTAAPVDGHLERARAFAQYLIRYAFVRDFLPSVDALGQAHRMFGIVELFKLMPRRMSWIDNAQAFGHKQVIEG
jgi:uncharacterized protein